MTKEEDQKKWEAFVKEHTPTLKQKIKAEFENFFATVLDDIKSIPIMVRIPRIDRITYADLDAFVTACQEANKLDKKDSKKPL